MIDPTTYDDDVAENREVWCPTLDDYGLADVIRWRDGRQHGRWFGCPLCGERHEPEPEGEW